MVKVGVVGGTGNTGVELLRLLSGHPDTELVTVTSRTEAGRAVSDLFPGLRGYVDLPFSSPDEGALNQCNLVFFATPNGIAMNTAPALLAKGIRVIDLAADFRLKNSQDWQHWYGTEHHCPTLLDEAIYGLPEVNREQIASARLVANPGCYPTAAQLGLLPLVEAGIISGNVIVDAKSGVSGAGRNNLLCETYESFKAYAVAGHRHLPEIRQGLQAAANKQHQTFSEDLTFVPHLTPMIRGIHATIYCQVKDRGMDLQALFQQRFEAEPFVDVMPAGSHPETGSVKACNQCRIAVHRPQGMNTVVVLSVIDNLVKGAAGQAVQNMNIMFGFKELSGLNHSAISL
ncbi:N-acetyl-gamma-glutamyl-phosphate reductase [Candidatus Sororendozoicomonas aggregata]|uniref:N-acetyl-gamma-glutamyl-phosphate reductase n=1 Tax=Candidatus Sororendozoicomonas aggregata TaxID=3073239 RepID=UPI002ED37A45